MSLSPDPAPQPPIGKLMLIDDSRIEQLLHRRQIDRAGVVGKVVTFSYAEEALAELVGSRDTWPDAILLDINMPRMDGFEFVDAFQRAVGATVLPPIIMLTTSLDPRDEERAAGIAAIRDFMVKPLTADDMIRLARII